MDSNQLQKLVGERLEDAKFLVYQSGLRPVEYAEGAITPAITMPKDVVRLYYDTDGRVVSAVTQQSIEERYKR